MAKPTIYVDTREQDPYTFKGYVVEERALKTGDYSVKGGLGKNGICLERKAMPDYFSTLTKKDNLARFKKELKRMEPFGFAAVLVEGTPMDVIRGTPRSAASGRLLLKLFMDLCLKYRVSPIFCGTREVAEQIALDLLTTYVNEDVARRWWCR